MPYAAAVCLSWRIKHYDCAVLLILGGAGVSIIYAHFLGTKSQNGSVIRMYVMYKKKTNNNNNRSFNRRDVKIY